jgi:hypothetical protein
MSKNYTAVIFFHGVGDPQRHVSLSSFLDHLDLYGQTQAETPIGAAQRFRYRSSATGPNQVLNYVELSNVRKRPDGTTFLHKRVRLYEAYWVPEAGARYSTIYLLGWLLIRIVNPVKLLSSKWRSYPGLRIWNLVYMASKPKTKTGLYKDLERAYHNFDAWENRRRFPKGSFSEFRQYVEEQFGDKRSSAALRLLHDWRRTFWRYNVTLLFKCLYYSAMGVTFLLLLGASIRLTVDAFVSEGIYATLGWQTLVAAASSGVIGAIWIGLRRHAIDVLTWTLDTEKDERIKARGRVVGVGRKIIRAIVDDPKCEDCILVGHSLGSCIAVEALLREGQFVRARGLDEAATGISDNITKIRDVFTVGSPLDRIFYFFESDRTFSHRYNRIYEEQRLTINLPPFWNLATAGSSRITNFWSRFDPISSPLFSVRKKVAERADAITNIECLPEGVPLPISTHVSYFSDPSVIGRIYKSIMTSGEVSPVEAAPPLSPSRRAMFSLFVAPPILAMVLFLLLLGNQVGAGVGFLLLLLTAWLGRKSAVRLRNHHRAHAGAYLAR